VLDVDVLERRLGVVRLEPEARVPAWAVDADFVSVTRTPQELSIVCDEHLVPTELRCERDWRCLAVRGPLDFDAVGVLESLAVPLAKARVSLLALSTYDTDYLLVRGQSLERAVEALLTAGHRVHRPRGV
jgi:hypothetical protein